MKQLKMNFFQLTLLSFIIMYIGAQRLHETGHWLIFQLYHRSPTIGFQGVLQSWDIQPSNLSKWQLFVTSGGEHGWFRISSLPQSSMEWIILLMMGQFFQILAILLGLIVLYRSKNIVIKTVAYLVVFLNALGQANYSLIKFIKVFGGDEYLAAHYLNISPRWFTGPLALFYIIIFIFMLYNLEDWKTRVKYFLAGVLTFSLGPILWKFDRIILKQSLLDNPFVQPIFGFSLPVLIVDIIVLSAFLLFIKKMHTMMSAESLSNLR